MCIHLPCNEKDHDLRDINVNNMFIHLPHNKNVHNLRYINVNNIYSSSTQQKGS